MGELVCNASTPLRWIECLCERMREISERANNRVRLDPLAGYIPYAMPASASFPAGRTLLSFHLQKSTESRGTVERRRRLPTKEKIAANKYRRKGLSVTFFFFYFTFLLLCICPWCREWWFFKWQLCHVGGNHYRRHRSLNVQCRLWQADPRCRLSTGYSRERDNL